MNQGGLRIAAVAAAGLMVVGALAGRSFLDDGDSGGGGGDADGPMTLACPPDLVDACRAADFDDVTVVVEGAATTAENIAAAEDASALEPDLWLTPRPWAEAAASLRADNRLDPLTDDDLTALTPVASSQVVLLIWDDRADALENGPCGGTLSWRCVGDAAEQRWEDIGGPSDWGRARIGITDPAASSGLVVLGALAADHVGATDFHPDDIGRDAQRWLDRFAASSDNAGPPDAVDTMLTQGEGYLAALGTTEAAASRAGDREELRIEPLAPELAVELVVVPLNDDARDRAEDLSDHGDRGPLAEALVAHGWRHADGSDGAATVPAPPGPVLHAVLDTWNAL